MQANTKPPIMKIRASKRNIDYVLFRLRTFNLGESALKLWGNPIAEAKFVLKQSDKLLRTARSEQHNHTALLDLDSLLNDGYIFIPAYRRDGVGIQAFVRICTLFLAQQVNATYFHIPFLELQHQDTDPMGQSLSVIEWSKKWEKFLNLGKDEQQITTLENQVGSKALARKMVCPNSQYGKPGQPIQTDLATFLHQSAAEDTQLESISVFDLRFFRESPSRLSFDTAFINRLQAKFEANNYVPQSQLYSDQFLDIAIHIRRGDVWKSYQAGEQRQAEEIRFVEEGYYVELLQRLQTLFQKSVKPVRFHIISDGSPSDFPQFTFISATEAHLKPASGSDVENIQFHLAQTSLDALYHLIKAPVLLPAKSSFSVLAVLFGKSYVLYDETIRAFYQYDFLSDYMQQNPRFVLIDDLAAHVDKILEGVPYELSSTGKH